MMRVTFSPLTAEPRYLRAIADAVLATQMQLAMDAWAAQIRFVEALGVAALAAQWSMVERVYQAGSRPE